MIKFTELQDTFNEYNVFLAKSQNIAIFTRDIKLQEKEIKNLKEFENRLNEEKRKHIETRNEPAANMILCLQLSTMAVRSEISMIVALKENDPETAWDSLIDAQNMIDSVIQNHPINGNTLLGYKKKLLRYETLLFPQMMFTSIGGIILESECSICKKPYDECCHIKGRFYMGEMCIRIIKEIDLEEVSIVDMPADKRCRPISLPDGSNIQRNIFTLKRK